MVNESTPILQVVPRRNLDQHIVVPSSKGKPTWSLVLICAIAVVLASWSSVALNDETQSSAFRSSVSNSSRPDFYLSSRKAGYGPLSNSVLTMYGLELVLEPYVENIVSLSSTTSDQLEAVWSIKYVNSTANELASSIQFLGGKSNGTDVHVILAPANAKFEITVTITTPLGDSFDIKRTAVTKFTRREIRSLTTDDRERYFNAVEKIFSLSMEEGQSLYGLRFSSADVFTGLHDSESYLYHNNLFFLTSHPAMQLRYEKALFAIDKEVPFPYWDFLIDSELGSNWTSSPLYDNEWFGPTVSIPGEKIPVLKGRFAGTKRIFDPDYKFDDAIHTLQDYLGLDWSPNREKFVTRSSDICGFQVTQGFSTCTHLSKCYERYLKNDYDLRSFDMCLEMMVHANLHTMHAGLWDCTVDWNEFYEDEKSWLDPELLSMLGMIQAPITVMHFIMMGWVTCPSDCSLEESCSCYSAVTGIQEPEDVETLSPLQAHNMTKKQYEKLYKYGYGGKRFIEKNADGLYVPIGVTEEQLYRLDKLCIKTSLWIGSFGDMASGAAANDPLFWVMHQLFDKAVHGLRMSSYYNSEEFIWNQDDDHDGMGWDSITPFKYTDFEPYIGSQPISSENKALTNQDLWALLKPDGESIPYVYDQLTNWGDCYFDPMADPVHR